MDTFDEMYAFWTSTVTRRKKEQTPDPAAIDENVFDIQQGVAVCLSHQAGEQL